MPLPDVEVKIISLDDGETELPQGEIGEIVVHGPQVMKGYHNMPTETANTLRQMKDGKTWLFTGDIARMDEDGYFYIVDRKKELIKPGGFQCGRKWKKHLGAPESFEGRGGILTRTAARFAPDRGRSGETPTWMN
jgi:acyl-coenzyme A synthetase/AMP-(fatty) acid ligase